MNDLRRILYVAEHYRQLQGLRLLPLSVPFLLSGVWRLLGPAAGSTLPRTGWLVLLTAGVAASAPIGRYYARRFGSAAVLPWRTALSLLVAVAAIVALEWVQERLEFPLSLPVMFVAIVLARVGLSADRLRIHYVWIAAACALFAALAPLGVPPDVRSAALDVLVGGSLVIAALGDDRVLRRALTRRALA
jgi:hypothetical protein